MQSQGQVWIFFDKETKKKTKPMSLVEAQMLVLGLKTKQIKRLYLWTPGWAEWQKLTDFLKKDQKTFAMAPEKVSSSKKSRSRTEDSETLITSEAQGTLTSIPSDKTTTEVSSTQKTTTETYNEPAMDYNKMDFHGDHLLLNAKKGNQKPNPRGFDVEKRKEMRVPMKLEVILVSKNGKSFRSHSVNLSLNGVLLEAAIPRDFLGLPFDLIIVNRFESDPKKSRILFKGKMVGDVTNPCRVTFLEPSQDTILKLSNLIRQYEISSELTVRKVG